MLTKEQQVILLASAAVVAFLLANTYFGLNF